MGLGILEDRKLDHVPGSVNLYEDARRREEEQAQRHLKKDRSGCIVLVPQPSDDPNDPLNWPIWKRDCMLAILCFITIMATVATPQLAAISIKFIFQFEISYQAIALLTGYHLCGVGVAGILFVPTARVWGKRHLFLLGTLLVIIAGIWGGASTKSHGSFVWARVFQGVGLAPFEALINAVVGDLYCVHERGPRMALTNVALFGAAFLTPVVVGKMTDSSLGWPWSFYFTAIFTGAAAPLLFFFVPETAFVRAPYLNLDYETKDIDEARRSTSTELSALPGSTGNSTEAFAEKDMTATHDLNPTSVMTQPRSGEAPPAKKSFSSRLKPFNGRYTSESFWKLLLRPFVLFLHPAILWASLVQGVIIGWTVFIGVVLASVFQTPPQHFSYSQVGYLYAGAFIGSIVGLPLSGVLAELTNKLLIRLNHGHYEPEFRLFLVIPMAIFCGAGLYGFGITSNDIERYGWAAPDAFFLLTTVGMVMGAVASALYIVDAHRDIAVEAFTCLLIFKNLFSFILTYYAFEWVFKLHKDKLFAIFGSIQIGICVLTIPLYVFGKRNRSFFHRHDLLTIFRLRTPGASEYNEFAAH